MVVEPLFSLSGEAGLDAGADFVLSAAACFGSVVPQISHSRRDGWLRNVQAVHAIPSLPAVLAGAGLVGILECRTSPSEGSDDDSCWPCKALDRDAAGMGIGSGTEVLGTPQSAHTLAAAGLRPEGFRLPHTSHVQLANDSFDTAVDALALTTSVSRCNVIFADDLNKPA